MTAVLLWKEYRQQRSLWLVIAFLAILLVVMLTATLGQGGGFRAFQEERLREGLNVTILALIVSYGVVSGALLLASESDEGTLVFLDTLSGRRSPLWARKLLAGAILTLSLSFALVALAVGLGFASWQTVLVLPLLGLDALVWGLLGGALCRRVLTAVLTGIAFMAFTWMWLPLWDSNLAFALGKTAAAIVGVYFSWRQFAGVDRSRQLASKQVSSKAWSLFPASWGVLLWLAFRQGRWILAAGLVGALVLGGTVNAGPLILWPIGTLLLGLIFGLSTFMLDQGDGARFLGAQRFPPGRIWTAKILFWGAALFGLTVLAWYVGVMTLISMNPNVLLFQNGPRSESAWWFTKWMQMGGLTEIVNPFVFLGLWPLYGFCFGQFFVQLAPRPVLAVILAAFIAPLVVALWIPSLLLGGLSFWQWLVVPALLLLSTRLAQKPWLSGRLLTARPLTGIAGGVALMVLGLVGGLWYRVVEVPDVGEPFDVKEFAASLPPAETNEAGPLIRRAGAKMWEYRTKVEQELAPPQPANVLPGNLQPAQAPTLTYNTALGEVVWKGWPSDDTEIARWLDKLFEGEWVRDAQKAAQLPLGFVEDPRLLDVYAPSTNIYEQSHALAALFTARALQLQARGDSRAALSHLETVLALSRQFRNYAPYRLMYYGLEMERVAISGFRLWLQKLGPDKELLRTAVAILQRHEAVTPDLANTIKADYLIYRNSEFSRNRNPEKQPVGDLLTVVRQVPWEKERQLRIARAIVSGLLRGIQQPIWKTSGWGQPWNVNTDRAARQAGLVGLPPENGPGSRLSAHQWGELVFQFDMYNYDKFHGPSSMTHMLAARSQQMLHIAQLVTTLALYQADHGEPPDQLDALVPAYLAVLPIDPWNGNPFGYRVSKGEKIEGESPPLVLAPGQAVVFTVRSNGSAIYPVPVWKK